MKGEKTIAMCENRTEQNRTDVCLEKILRSKLTKSWETLPSWRSCHYESLHSMLTGEHVAVASPGVTTHRMLHLDPTRS